MSLLNRVRRFTSGVGYAALLLIIMLTLGSPISAAAQDEKTYSLPLGTGLETWPYPYPVQYFSLEIEGQPLRFAYMDIRPVAANGQAAVLLHGKNFDGSYWDGTIKALTAAGYRVIVPDQIGFGKSSKPDIAYSFDLLANNTARLLDSLGIERAVVIGHSMGGMLAVRFARTYPQRTSRLILENPIGLEDYRFSIPPQPLSKVYESELNQIDPVKIRAFYKQYVVDWKPAIYERFVEARTRISLSGEYPRWAKASALTYQMIYQQPVRHEFGLIQPPTLLIIGQMDRTIVGRNFAPKEALDQLGQYPRLGKAAARDIPGSHLIELQNVGHIPHLEAPEAFNQAILLFIKP